MSDPLVCRWILPFLWVLALERATPTRVANTITVNPIAAGLLAILAGAEGCAFTYDAVLVPSASTPGS